MEIEVVHLSWNFKIKRKKKKKTQRIGRKSESSSGQRNVNMKNEMKSITENTDERRL